MKKLLVTAIVVVSQLFGLYAQVKPSSHKVIENGLVTIDTYQNVASLKGLMRDSCNIISTKNPDGTIVRGLFFYFGKKTKTKIQESGSEIPVYMLSSNLIFPDSLIISEYKEGNTVKSTEYYVVGEKTIRTDYYNYRENQNYLYVDTDRILKSESTDNKRGRFEISPAFYNELKRIYGNNVTYARETHEYSLDLWDLLTL